MRAAAGDGSGNPLSLPAPATPVPFAPARPAIAGLRGGSVRHLPAKDHTMTTKLLNIAALSVAATAALHVKSASGELLYADAERTLPVRIHLHGPGSKIASVIDGRQTQRSLKRMQDNDNKVTAASPEERKAETAEDLAELTVRFENFTYGDGSLTGADLFRAVYEDQSLGFITRQVGKFFNDWGNFSGASKAA